MKNTMLAINSVITVMVIVALFITILFAFGGFRAQIEDVTFKYTGCQNNQTKLSDWKKVYNALNQ